METNEKELTPSESLALIRGMIDKTKGEVADDSFYFLFWGWLVFSCCLVEFFLKVYIKYPGHYFVWWLMPVGGIISAVYGSKRSKQTHVKTFIGDAISFLWIGLCLGFGALIIIGGLISKGPGWQTPFTYYILLYGIGTFVCGSILRFRPLIIGGVINYVLAVVSVKLNFDYQLLIAALAILTSYIIPGHLLRMKYQHQKK